MSAALSSFAIRPLGLCLLGWGVCAGAVWAQSEDAGQEPLARPVLQLELATPWVPGQPDKPLALTGWYGSPSAQGAAWGLGLALPGPGQSAGRYGSGVDLGLRWRSVEDGQGRVHVGLWQRLAPVPESRSLAQQIAVQPGFDTRLEMQFSAASARGVRFELGGALGMQLNKDEKIMLRAKRGKPMIYYRALF